MPGVDLEAFRARQQPGQLLEHRRRPDHVVPARDDENRLRDRPRALDRCQVRLIEHRGVDHARRQPVEVRELPIEECARGVLVRKPTRRDGRAGSFAALAVGSKALDSRGERNPSDGVGQHELVDPLGKIERRPHAGPSPHRLAHESCRRHAEMVEQRDRVRGELRRVEFCCRAHRTSESPAVVGNAAIVACERAELIEPARRVAGRTVAEEDRFALAGLGEIEIHLVFEYRHVSVPGTGGARRNQSALSSCR